MCAEAVSLRLCREEDLPQIEEILGLCPEAAGWSAAALRATFKEHTPYLLIATQQTQIVGFICGRKMVDEGEILNLAVRPLLRRLGVGRRLVQAFLRIAANQGVVKVHLEVRESNTVAIQFYTGVGFRQAGKRPGYYQAPAEAAVLMTAMLGRQ